MPPIPSEILRQVKGIAIRTRGLVDTLLSGEYRSVFRGQGMEFAEVGGYQPGDDYRTIDWNVSARLGAPYVKTFTEEREVTLFLVVDRKFVEHLSNAEIAQIMGRTEGAVKSLYHRTLLTLREELDERLSSAASDHTAEL